MNSLDTRLLARTSFPRQRSTETDRRMCVQLTESDVCASEFWRRCCGVLKDEGEEWGLSQAWGRRRRSGREGRDEWVRVTHQRSHLPVTSVQLTSTSPSLESIDRRPEEQNRSYPQIRFHFFRNSKSSGIQSL